MATQHEGLDLLSPGPIDHKNLTMHTTTWVNGQAKITAMSDEELIQCFVVPFQQHRPMTLATCQSDPSSHAVMKKYGIVADHCYSVADVDARARTVSVRNPWGTSLQSRFTTGGESKAEHGELRTDGIPVADLKQMFSEVDIGEPL